MKKRAQLEQAVGAEDGQTTNFIISTTPVGRCVGGMGFGNYGAEKSTILGTA